jgi:hypothetical protein
VTAGERRIARILARRAELAALKAIWESSPTYGMGALLEALGLCIDNDLSLPSWLARAVRAELMHRISKQPLIHYRRWREVRRMRDARPVTPDFAKMRPGRPYSLPPAKEISYEATLRWAAEKLGSSVKAIERSYSMVENDLPKAQRYRRTYAKRTR